MSVCLESNSSSVVLPAQKVNKLTTENGEENGSSTSSNAVTVPNSPTAISKQTNINTNTVQSEFQGKGNSNSSVITVVNTPITVVKNITGTGPVKNDYVNNGGLPVAPISDKQQSGIHNVFVKKSTPAEGGGISVPDMPQSHKLLTANTFPSTNVFQKLSPTPIAKTANGQRTGKVKVLNPLVMQSEQQSPSQHLSSSPGPSNVILNKNQRFFHQQKLIGNGATKFITKPAYEGGPQAGSKRVVYPVPKNLKTMTGYKNSAPAPVDTKSAQPHSKLSLQHRSGLGLKTIPPQRLMSGGNKPNYIGKHAVQAQKVKPKVKSKLLQNTNVTSGHLPTSPIRQVPDRTAQTIFNQALTAQILETLSDKESIKPQSTNSYIKYDQSVNKVELISTANVQRDLEVNEYKPRSVSTLDTLSFVCQAVLLDHNYNATLPPDPPPKPPTPLQTPPSVNGTQHQQFSPISNFSPSLQNVKRIRSVSQSTPTIHARDEDAVSDISEHKDTEGEETDTAPEAEAVSKDAQDRYGDYVTRCICGFIHDDGFMIECDKCKVWQHVRCVVKTKKVPDDYSCEVCDPRIVDKQKARTLQQQWMREIQERDAKMRKEQMDMSDSDSSDAEAHNKNRRKDPPRRQRRDSLHNRTRPGKRKERKVSHKRVKTVKPGKSDDEKIPQIRQWIENYEEAVTNHYSPELRARISSVRLNGAHSEITGGVDPSVNKCRVQTNPSTNIKYLVASVSLPMGTPVIELRGKYMLSTQHRSTTRQQRPGPFLFFHTLIKDTEVCVDTRTYGNSARFVRRSCTPNAKLQHVLEKGAVHLYVVTTKSVEKGSELTIRHESHDIAVASLTEIPCACVNPEYCALIKGHRRHNGDVQLPQTQDGRKRRGRNNRDAIASPPLSQQQSNSNNHTEISQEEKDINLKVDIKNEEAEEPKYEPEIKKDVNEEIIAHPLIKEDPVDAPIKNELTEEEDLPKETPTKQPRQISTRRLSRHSQEQQVDSSTTENDKKPMSREERKMAAIVKAIERLEKQELRRQEHQAKQQASRRESDSNKEEGAKIKRKKRKGRARTTSTSTITRRNRLDSADSLHSSDDTLLSPPTEPASPTKAAGLLLALANGECRKSPDRQDSSNSAHSSPETPLSAACLMVAAAVEPLEPGFKFPKTKKGLMNEWLNKSDVVQAASAISPSSLTPHIESNNSLFASSPAKCINALGQTVTLCDQPRSAGSAKKRWLRQAISEDQCDSPPQADAIAPPKKRKLPRESLSSESSPPSTPTNIAPPQVEIITHQDEDGLSQMESDATLNELASEMRQEYGSCIQLPSRECVSPERPVLDQSLEIPMETRIVSIVTTPSVDSTSVTPTVVLSPIINSNTTTPSRAILDPRLAPRVNTSELVGTVEKTLSFLGYEEKKNAESITPAKRKLSIIEYRQRKKLNNNDKSGSNVDDQASITEESNSSQSPKMLRMRSNSTSSVTSASTSEDEQISSVNQSTPVEVKALSAFNSEPTELERQRESASLRLKRALGLTLDNQPKNLTFDVETILKNDIPTPIKSSLSLTSPSFPIPGSAEPILSTVNLEKPTVEEAVLSSPPRLEPEAEFQADEITTATATFEEDIDEETHDGNHVDNQRTLTYPLEERKVLYYTPDDEEAAESATYVPPFDNPLYPNTNYSSYGSVIDDDAPYEGRNPSPPPDLRQNPT